MYWWQIHVFTACDQFLSQEQQRQDNRRALSRAQREVDPQLLASPFRAAVTDVSPTAATPAPHMLSADIESRAHHMTQPKARQTKAAAAMRPMHVGSSRQPKPQLTSGSAPRVVNVGQVRKPRITSAGRHRERMFSQTQTKPSLEVGVGFSMGVQPAVRPTSREKRPISAARNEGASGSGRSYPPSSSDASLPTTRHGRRASRVLFEEHVNRSMLVGGVGVGLHGDRAGSIGHGLSALVPKSASTRPKPKHSKGNLSTVSGRSSHSQAMARAGCKPSKARQRSDPARGVGKRVTSHPTQSRH